MPHYRHTQFGTLIPILFVPIMALIIALIMTVPETRPITGFVLAVMIVVGILFSTLTVDVSSGEIVASFSIGLIRRSIRVTDVREARVVRNKWWYGFGVRLIPHGWMFNVSGLDAVELEFENGRRFRIGTDEPERLLEAIQGARPTKQAS